MKPLYVVAVCAFVLAQFYAPITAQTTGSSSSDDDTWKKVAIIVPIVISALTLFIFLCYCCCCQGAGNGWGCGDCRNCGNCGNCGDCGYCCDMNRCCGPGCGDMCRCNGCGEMCGCNGCGEMCRCNCGNGECCGCNCGNCCGLCGGNCCGGCCPQAQPAYYGDNRVVYSSSQGPIRVEDAYVYRNQPPQGGAGFSNSGYSSSLPVNGGDRYPVYGGFRSGGDSSGGFGVYGIYPNNLSYPPVTRQAGCGCK